MLKTSGNTFIASSTASAGRTNAQARRRDSSFVRVLLTASSSPEAPGHQLLRCRLAEDLLVLFGERSQRLLRRRLAVDRFTDALRRSGDQFVVCRDVPEVLHDVHRLGERRVVGAGRAKRFALEYS